MSSMIQRRTQRNDIHISISCFVCTHTCGLLRTYLRAMFAWIALEPEHVSV